MSPDRLAGTDAQHGAKPPGAGMFVGAATEWLAGLPLAERVVAADEYRNLALTLVGHFADIRRAFIAAADAQGVEVPASKQSIRDAVRPDRQLLQRALGVLDRCGMLPADSRQVDQARGPRARLAVVARGFLVAVRDIKIEDLPNDLADNERHLIAAAIRRAHELLPDN